MTGHRWHAIGREEARRLLSSGVRACSHSPTSSCTSSTYPLPPARRADSSHARGPSPSGSGHQVHGAAALPGGMERAEPRGEGLDPCGRCPSRCLLPPCPILSCPPGGRPR
jgi:hypothetical protein